MRVLLNSVLLEGRIIKRVENIRSTSVYVMIGMGIVVEALCSNRLKEDIAQIPDDTLVLFTGRLQKGYVAVDFIEKSKERGLLSDVYAPQE